MIELFHYWRFIVLVIDEDCIALLTKGLPSDLFHTRNITWSVYSDLKSVYSDLKSEDGKVVQEKLDQPRYVEHIHPIRQSVRPSIHQTTHPSIKPFIH